MSKFSKNRSFQIERLEDRKMMAADLAADMYLNSNGLAVLTIKEAAGHLGGSSTISVSQPNSKTIRVTGESGTLINGKSSMDFSTNGFVPSLFTYMGGGKDQVFVNGGRWTSLSIDAGVSNTGRIFLGDSDSDIVIINGASTVNYMSITTGASNDYVTVLDPKVGVAKQTASNYADLLINTGAGADSVLVKAYNNTSYVQGDLSVQTYESLADPDNLSVWNDVVTIQGTTVYDNASVVTGGGMDKVEFTNVTTHRKLSFNTGAEADTVDMVGVYANQVEFNTGAGSDVARLRDVRVNHNLNAYMSDGDDALDLNYVQSRTRILDGGAGLNDRLTMSSDMSFNAATDKYFESYPGLTAMAYRANTRLFLTKF